VRNNITENESKHAKRKFLNERLVEQTGILLVKNSDKIIQNS